VRKEGGSPPSSGERKKALRKAVYEGGQGKAFTDFFGRV